MPRRDAYLRRASFRGLLPKNAQAAAVGRGNRQRGSTPELMLQTALRSFRRRFDVNAVDLPGAPDIVFRRARLAIFVDGDFWHARAWNKRRKKLRLGHNGKYWVSKIHGNRRRDRAVNRELGRLGWRVLRVWESDVLRASEHVLARIRESLLH